MSRKNTAQVELDFAGSTEQGWERWREERTRQVKEFSAILGLPLGEEVEIWIRGEVRLRGTLSVRQNGLSLAKAVHDKTVLLEVDGVLFSVSEIISCVRVE
jgi:hypothetical protein